MDEIDFCHPRESAQKALALLTASAHDDDESIYVILKEMGDRSPAVLVALCALVVGGWPEDAEMEFSRWLVELGKRVAVMTEFLPPAP